VIRKYRHLSGKNKISKFLQVGKISTDSNICHTSVYFFYFNNEFRGSFLYFLSTIGSAVCARTVARFTKYPTTIVRLSYDNATKVAIDLRRTYSLPNVLQRTQGFP